MFKEQDQILYSVLSKLDKAEYATLTHAFMCAYNSGFGYKSVARFIFCFNPDLYAVALCLHLPYLSSIIWSDFCSKVILSSML